MLRTRSSAEWLERLEAHDVPCVPVLTRAEMIRHPQVQAMNAVVEYEHEHAGRLRQSRTPAEFSGTPAEIRRGAPALGAHNDEVLREAGFDDRTIRQLRAEGAFGTPAAEVTP